MADLPRGRWCRDVSGTTATTPVGYQGGFCLAFLLLFRVGRSLSRTQYSSHPILFTSRNRLTKEHCHHDDQLLIDQHGRIKKEREAEREMIVVEAHLGPLVRVFMPTTR